MGDFERGYTFVYGGTVNADRLHRLVSDGRLTRLLDRSHADQTKYTFISDTQPGSPYNKELWLNKITLSGGEQTSYMYHLCAKVSGIAGWFATSPSYVTVVNNTGQTITLGTLLMPAGSVTASAGGYACSVSLCDQTLGTNTITLTYGNWVWFAQLGVAADNIPDGEHGLCVTSGRAVAHTVAGGYSAGDRLGLTDTPGVMDVPAYSATLRTMGYALTHDIGDATFPRCDIWMIR